MPIKRKKKTDKKMTRDELFSSYVERENAEAKRILELCTFLYTNGRENEALKALEDRRKKLMSMADSFDAQIENAGVADSVKMATKKLSNSLRFIAFGVEKHMKMLKTGELHLSPYSISQTASESGSD